MARNIKVYSTITNSVTEVSLNSGDTFATLCSKINCRPGEVTGVGKQSKTNYSAGETVISDMDDFIGIYPAKMKSGGKNVTRYSEHQIREIRTKLNNMFADMLNEKPAKGGKPSGKPNESKYSREIAELNATAKRLGAAKS